MPREHSRGNNDALQSGQVQKGEILSQTSQVRESRRVLYIQSVMFHFVPWFSDPEDEDFNADDHKTFIMYVHDVPLLIRIIRTTELSRRSHKGQKRMVLLLAGDIIDEGWIEHLLLLLQPVGDHFERRGVNILVGAAEEAEDTEGPRPD